MQQDLARSPGLNADEQDDDAEEGGSRDDEVHGQRRQHAAIVEQGQEGEEENGEGLPGNVVAELLRADLHQLSRDQDVAGVQHGVGEHHEQADIEGHQRADGVLGLRVLAAGRGDGRGHLGIDHGHAGVEHAADQAGDQRAESAALARGVVPAHELADENDADAERPDMRGAEDFQQVERLRRGCDVVVVGTVVSTMAISSSLQWIDRPQGGARRGPRGSSRERFRRISS